MFTKAPWKNEKQSGTGTGLALCATKAGGKKKDLGSIVSAALLVFHWKTQRHGL